MRWAVIGGFAVLILLSALTIAWYRRRRSTAVSGRNPSTQPATSRGRAEPHKRSPALPQLQGSAKTTRPSKGKATSHTRPRRSVGLGPDSIGSSPGIRRPVDTELHRMISEHEKRNKPSRMFPNPPDALHDK